jgi:CheY-like chemotaxis protein/HPt (histidine-containing phosphotransfer) domain-containing protein
MERKPAMTPPSLPPPSPRVLLVEDDPVSCAFLAAAIGVLPVEVDVAVTCAAALQQERKHHYQLWLIDANLPDGNGRDLFRDLRVSAPATPALAHTASRDPSELDALIDAGFAEVLIKPLTAVELQAAVQRALHLRLAPAESMPPRCGELPVWDDSGAASALNGNPTHVAALRRLFLDELPTQRDAVMAALRSDDIEAANAQFHRLRASCGFVGAARLGEAVRMLQQSPESGQAQDDFAHAVDDALLPP